MDPSSSAYWIDLCLKAGAFSVLLYIAVRWGKFQQLVDSGFKSIEEKLDGVGVRLNSHSDRLAKHEYSIGRLEGRRDE